MESRIQGCHNLTSIIPIETNLKEQNTLHKNRRTELKSILTFVPILTEREKNIIIIIMIIIIIIIIIIM